MYMRSKFVLDGQNHHALPLTDLRGYQANDHVVCFDLLKAEWSIHDELDSWRTGMGERSSRDCIIGRCDNQTYRVNKPSLAVFLLVTQMKVYSMEEVEGASRPPPILGFYREDRRQMPHVPRFIHK